MGIETKAEGCILSVSRLSDSGELVGLSEINVTVDDGDSLSKYLIRVNGMLNLAFAAASLPLDMDGDVSPSDYQLVLNYIDKQYKSITGKSFEVGLDQKNIANRLRRIVIHLPRSYRMDYREISEYNAAALAALISA